MSANNTRNSQYSPKKSNTHKQHNSSNSNHSPRANGRFQQAQHGSKGNNACRHQHSRSVTDTNQVYAGSGHSIGSECFSSFVTAELLSEAEVPEEILKKAKMNQGDNRCYPVQSADNGRNRPVMYGELMPVNESSGWPNQPLPASGTNVKITTSGVEVSTNDPGVTKAIAVGTVVVAGAVAVAIACPAVTAAVIAIAKASGGGSSK